VRHTLLARVHALRGALVVTTATVAVAAVVTTGGADAAARPLQVSVSGDQAEVRRPAPGGLPCARGGSDSFHQFAETALAGGKLSNLPGTLRLNLDAHADDATKAYLVQGGSHATLVNPRGTVRLAFTAGSCADQTLAFDGTTLSGSGTWAVDPDATTDAYAGAGTFQLSADLGDGGPNPWSLDLDGALAVRQPDVKVELVRSYWGRLGADYAGRLATVVYRVTNTGAGDAFRAKLVKATSTTGIVAVEQFPTELDDLAPGESVLVTVRYKVGLKGQRKGPLLTGREFDTTLTLLLPDALDAGAPRDVTLTVSAPAFPPAL
jgi:hypothetical protein